MFQIVDCFFFFAICKMSAKNGVQYQYSFTDYNWHSGLMMWSCDNDSSSNYSSEVRTGSQAPGQAPGTLGMSCVTQVEDWSHDQDQDQPS